jgi:hypothetical protein
MDGGQSKRFGNDDSDSRPHKFQGDFAHLNVSGDNVRKPINLKMKDDSLNAKSREGLSNSSQVYQTFNSGQ